MALTRWTGGKTGTETMGSGTNSAYYTEIQREVPNTQYTESADPYGYHSGDIERIYETNYANKTGSLICTVNEVVVSITRRSSTHFVINSATPGWVRVSYVPFSEDLYFGKSSSSLPNTHSVEKVIPSNRAHIDEILVALHALSDYMQTKRERFSIEEYTGLPRDISIGLQANSPVITNTMQEILNEIVRLFNFGISSQGAAVTAPTYPLYNYRHIDADTLETIRADINTLEAALEI